jgi:M6 family metalloprotease-like protein
MALAFLSIILSASYTVSAGNGLNTSRVTLQSGLTPWRPRPVLGAQKTLVLLVEFSDIKFLRSFTRIDQLMSVVNEWYGVSSYGKMSIQYTIHHEVITLSGTMASYGAPEPGASRGDDPERLDEYIRETIERVLGGTSVDLLEYRHVVIIHAGEDEASAAGNPNQIWSFCACEGPYAEENPEDASWKLVEDGRIVHIFWGISTFSEDEPWGVLAHEFGHSIGLNDLYLYGDDGYSEEAGVGLWSMMASGGFLDPPADIDAWSKYILGWIDPVIVESNEGEYTIHTLDSADDPKALLIRIAGSADEYYFVHARRKAGIDEALPSEGVLVMRIDASQERSFRGRELAVVMDANPETPEECRDFTRRTESLCDTLDAPYNEIGKTYPFSQIVSAHLVLNNDEFSASDAGLAFRVEPAGEDGFRLTFGITPTETATTGDTSTASRCLIATATYGSDLAPQVQYMRHVRDDLVGSSRTGSLVITSWNGFYYAWSPQVAQAISASQTLRGIFRILLLPLIVIVHLAAMVFHVAVNITASPDLASLVAFITAALLSVATYVVGPLLVFTKTFGRWIR